MAFQPRKAGDVRGGAGGSGGEDDGVGGEIPCQSTIVNTIPLWKNQMVPALGLAHTQKAMQAERAVTDMTNDLLKKNADALKMGTIETAKESQRGVVDIETLQQTNKSLIETLDELNKIQTEGRAKRAAAEQELTRIEDELKAKMMEIRS